MSKTFGYIAVIAVVLCAGLYAVKSPSSSTMKAKSAIEQNIEAKKKALEEI